MRLKPVYSRPVSLCALLVCLMAPCAPLGATQAQGANLDLVVINTAGDFLLYQGGALEKLLSSHAGLQALYDYSLAPDSSEVSPSATYSDLGALIREHQVDLWYFSGQEALGELNQAQKYLLRADIQQGAVVGINGEGRVLAEQLDLHGQNGYSSLENDAYSSYFANATLDELREDFTILTSERELGASWSQVLAWAETQLTGNVNAPVSGSDDFNPWTAIYNHQWNDYSSPAGESLGVSVYKLTTANKDYDWYRVDLIQQSRTENYNYGWFSGALWGMHNYIGSIDVWSFPNNHETGVQLIDHMPLTTLSNTSKSFSLGGSLEGEVDTSGWTGRGSLQVSYSVTYECPDMIMYDYTNHAIADARWSAVPRQPDFAGWPLVWSEPALAARTSYEYQPSILLKYPKGVTFDLRVGSSTTFKNDQYYFLVWSETDYKRGVSANIVIK